MKYELQPSPVIDFPFILKLLFVIPIIVSVRFPTCAKSKLDEIDHVLVVFVHVVVMCGVAVFWIGRAALIITVVAIAMERFTKRSTQCRVHSRSDLFELY